MNPWHLIVTVFTAVTLLFSNFGIYEKQEQKTVFIAHRGYSSQYLENTEEAFIKAAEAGFGGCETDVRLTSDGYMVLSHGGGADFADGTSLDVETSTLEELTAKPLKNDMSDTVLYLCTFERYIEIMKQYDMFCFIELKGEWQTEKIFSQAAYPRLMLKIHSQANRNHTQIHQKPDNPDHMEC